MYFGNDARPQLIPFGPSRQESAKVATSGQSGCVSWLLLALCSWT